MTAMSMPSAAPEGIRVTVAAFRPTAGVGTIALPTLLQLVPSPRQQEDKRALKHASGSTKRHAEVRELVQRMLKGTQKGKNVDKYARYIGDGIKKELGAAWSTPPITLWLSKEPGAASEELIPGSGICTLTLTAGTPVVAIDGETQVTALHELSDNPAKYGLTVEELAGVRLPFELYWGLSVEDARQIFYDRNVEGVPVAKNLAMSMDQRDFGTHLAHRIADAVKVEQEGKLVPLSTLVQSRKRQLGKTDPEVVTLSALRGLVLTSIFGRNGIGLSSATVHEDKLPEEVAPEQIEREVVDALSTLVTELFPYFAARSAISAPAVLAGIGVAANPIMSWSDGGQTVDGLLALLADVAGNATPGTGRTWPPARAPRAP
ncbi:DNA sulfur modification protein DndB [Actinomadura sp. CNU-125]|uniref:DNA sulfur modification protein DndB n=1 Tax=Actinomadura sp. CNU-125 TaxID=1904961 RepID=UPI000A8B766B|nr:DNA sulfur modification protein DndB [Actinomadura sp. CNU-125]